MNKTALVRRFRAALRGHRHRVSEYHIDIMAEDLGLLLQTRRYAWSHLARVPVGSPQVSNTALAKEVAALVCALEPVVARLGPVRLKIAFMSGDAPLQTVRLVGRLG